MDKKEQALTLHHQYHGKLTVESKIPVTDNEMLSLVYSPGVAEPCLAIEQDPELAYAYTMKGNTIAVVTDGTAVLGLGDIGPTAALPVMEGKAMLLKEFGGVNAVPICLDTTDPEKIIEAVCQLAPTFGGINLEDISSPRCFDIEKQLDKRLSIPVFHDDQHGTAIVVLAALLNSLKVVGKKMDEIHVVVNGPGAAGTAIIHMLQEAGVQHILAFDLEGCLTPSRKDLDEYKQALAQETNPEGIEGTLKDNLENVDVFIGVSGPNVLTADDLKKMNKDAIVFAMANPVPEVDYDLAKEAGIKVMGTGRSDYPNQINNLLAFPGIFKGALSVGASTINREMKIAAAEAIAGVISENELREDYVLPSPFDKRVPQAVAEAVAKAAYETNVANTRIKELLNDDKC